MPFRRLPALTALRAFEAAARHCSFKVAAAELAVTPGAVSQQIRALEEDLGVKLFTRAVRAVALTEEGRRLQPVLTEAFMQIRDALDALRPKPLTPLRVEASGPVITKWLLPRLHRFVERYPELGVTVGSSEDLRPCERDEVFIRFNETPGNGVFAVTLCTEFVLPLASPELVARLDLRQTGDIMRAPLLHDTSNEFFPNDPDWKRWFKLAGLDPAGAQRGTRFDPRAADHAIDAAVNGAGVVLGRRFLARKDMLEGRLVSPFGPMIPMHARYFVVCQEGQQSRPDIAAFINWMREETAGICDDTVLDSAV